MEPGVELDALIARMIEDYVSRNRAAKVLRQSLDEAGVGFYPVADHLTLRTLNIDRRAEEFTRLGYGYSETIEYEDWYAKVYRKVGYPRSSWIKPIPMIGAAPASSLVGSRHSAIRCSIMWRCGWKTSNRRLNG